MVGRECTGRGAFHFRPRGSLITVIQSVRSEIAGVSIAIDDGQSPVKFGKDQEGNKARDST